MSYHSARLREVLQELGAPPELPTQRELNNLVAQFEPERLEQVKTKLKDVLKQNQTEAEHPTKLDKTDKVTEVCYTDRTSSEPSKTNRTHILEMELLKLKGQFHRNKTTTLNLIKKLSNERELVKDSIKELSSTRREELDLVEAIKRDNLDLIVKKNQLEMDLMEMSDKMEMLISSLGETQRCTNDKEQRLHSLELEKLELSKQIETLKLKVKIDHFEPQRQIPPNIEWNPFANLPLPICFKSLLVLLICFAGFCFCYSRSTDQVFSDSTCKDCDYERDIYTRINI